MNLTVRGPTLQAGLEGLAFPPSADRVLLHIGQLGVGLGPAVGPG